jgi:hypothetical protein
MGTRFAVVAMTLAAGVLVARCSACTNHGGETDPDVRDTHVVPVPEPEEAVHVLPPGARVPPDPECFDQGMPACCACGTCNCDCYSDGECDDSNPCTQDHCGFAGNTFACEHRVRECPGGMACDRRLGTCQPAPFSGCDPEGWYDECPAGTACDYDTGLCAGDGLAGYPCVVDADCRAGLCLADRDGWACAESCVDSCADPAYRCGLVLAGGEPAYYCLPRWPNLCRPCRADAECQAADGYTDDFCVDLGAEGSFCGADCAIQSCPDGYVCQHERDASGYEWPQCVPSNGVCECGARFALSGAATDCFVENEHGRCPGSRVCTADGLSDCDAPVPAEEACNGLDDDCDGHTDEGFADSDANGVPDCLEAAPCDEESLAEDCDGDGVPNGEDNCANAANPDQANWDLDNLGEGLGDLPGDACDADDDNDGTVDLEDCVPFDPAVYPGAVEICDGKDNSCDGVTDEGFPQGCE